MRSPAALPRRQIIGYGIGDLANGVTFGMSSTFLLAFYTDVLGITAVAAGTLFLVARIWDAVNDPMMGAIADGAFRRRARRIAADRASGADGGRRVDKFRPFLVWGSWPVVVAAILMFVAPRSLAPTQRLVWAYATYIVWGMTYTFVNIPYGSLAAVMTTDPVERSTLAVARGIGGMVGQVAIRVVVPLALVLAGEDQAAGYLGSMVVLGVITLGAYVASWAMTSENVETTEDLSRAPRFTDTVAVIGRNRPFLAVAIASVAMLTGLMVNGAMLIYFFRENLAALPLLSVGGATAIVPVALVAPFVPRIVAKFGTHATAWGTSLASAVLWGILFILPSNVWLYLAVAMVAIAFLTVPNMIVWAMVSDSIDYNQYLSGQRQEGVIYGAYSFARKMGQAAAGFLAGAGLGAVGYVAGEVQSEATLVGIKFLTIGVPAIGMVVSFLAFRFIWNLTPAMQAQVAASVRAGAAADPADGE